MQAEGRGIEAEIQGHPDKVRSLRHGRQEGNPAPVAHLRGVERPGHRHRRQQRRNCRRRALFQHRSAHARRRYQHRPPGRLPHQPHSHPKNESEKLTQCHPQHRFLHRRLPLAEGGGLQLHQKINRRLLQNPRPGKSGQNRRAFSSALRCDDLHDEDEEGALHDHAQSVRLLLAGRPAGGQQGHLQWFQAQAQQRGIPAPLRRRVLRALRLPVGAGEGAGRRLIC